MRSIFRRSIFRRSASRFTFVPPVILGGALSLLAAAPGAAMDFTTIPIDSACSETNCPRAIVAEGEINASVPAEFSRFLRRELQVPGLHAIVFLNSPGGVVESSLKLGEMLHHSGAAVVVGRPVAGAATAAARGRKGRGKVAGLGIVPGHCASACVYTLMGAKKRVVPQGARLGVHRMSARMVAREPAGGSTTGSRVYAGDREIGELRAYVARVGGSQDLISLAESVPHDQIRVLSAAEIRRFRLGGPAL